MKIPTTRQQMFGDINKESNRTRRQINREVREKYFLIRNKRISGGE